MPTVSVGIALKLNHGVRQWPYIIAGVLFFVTFPASRGTKESKERTLTRLNFLLFIDEFLLFIDNWSVSIRFHGNLA